MTKDLKSQIKEIEARVEELKKLSDIRHTFIIKKNLDIGEKVLAVLKEIANG